MPISYGPNLATTWGSTRTVQNVLMKSYAQSRQVSDVFISHNRRDLDSSLALARVLDERRFEVYIDFYDEDLVPGDPDIDNGLVSTIRLTKSLVIVVSQNTRESWWVPWEVGISTPLNKPRAVYPVSAQLSLPGFLRKLTKLDGPQHAARWVRDNTT